MALTIAETEERGGKLIVTVEGASVDEVNSADAKKLAYAERGKHGYGNAGIEAVGGSYPQPTEAKEGEEAVIKYRHDFQLTPLI